MLGIIYWVIGLIIAMRVAIVGLHDKVAEKYNWLVLSIAYLIVFCTWPIWVVAAIIDEKAHR